MGSETTVSRKIAYFSLYLFIFTIPWENSLMIPGIGTISRLMGMISLSFGILSIITSGKLRRLRAPHLIMILFVSFSALSFLWSMDPAMSLARFWVYIQLLFMVWLIWEFAPRELEQRGLMQAYIFGAFASAFNTIYSVLTGANQILNYSYTRFVAGGFDPNDLGVILAMGIPLAAYLTTKQDKKILVLTNYIYLPIAVFAILSTASRGAFITTVVALITTNFIFIKKRVVTKGILLLVTLISVYVILSLVPESTWLRILTISDELKGGNISNRKDIWRFGFHIFRVYPILGVGAGAFSYALGSIYYEVVAHNTFLSILVEEGLLGFSIFVTLIVFLGKSTFKMKYKQKAVWMAMFLTWGVGVSSLTWEYRKPTWLLFGLITAQIYSANYSFNYNKKEVQNGIEEN